MKEIINCKKIDTAIKRAKAYLVIKAQKSGIYENFGQSEVRLIKEMFINLSDYSDKMNATREKLDSFNEWCATYSIDSFETKLKNKYYKFM